MSLLDTINKILHFGDHEQIAYSVILGALVGGLGVGIAKSSFIDDYSNLIELIIGGMILLNLPFNPITHGIGFVLAVDGFSSIVDQAFFVGDCIPFSCYQRPPFFANLPVRADEGDAVLANGGPGPIVPKDTPECRKYFNKLEKQLYGSNGNQGSSTGQGVLYTEGTIESPNRPRPDNEQDTFFEGKTMTSIEPFHENTEHENVSEQIDETKENSEQVNDTENHDEERSE